MKKKEYLEQKIKLKQLEHIQNAIGEYIDYDHRLQVEMQNKLEEEEIKWKQCAKQYWLQYWARNTKFYHMHAND